MVTLLDQFPYSIFFVDRSKAGNTIRCCSSVVSFICPSGLRLLLWVMVVSFLVDCWSAMMSCSVRVTFISAEVTLFL